MNQQTPDNQSDFFAAFQRPAWVLMMVAQMLLGLALGITLLVKFYMLVMGAEYCVPDDVTLANIIQCMPTLEIVAQFLLAAAGFRVAAFLFEDRPRAMLGGVLIALGGTFMMFLSELTVGTATWSVAATLVTLMLGVSLILLAQTLLFKRFPGPQDNNQNSK